MFNVARYAFRYSRVIINTSLTTLAPFITQPTNIYGSGHYTVVLSMLTSMHIFYI